MPDTIDHTEGRRLFGLNPEGYDATRPDYPDWIFDQLQADRALFDGATTLEIGPGTGRASRRLLAAGADPLTLIEPDERFASILASATREFAANCIALHQTFEDVSLPKDHFDLVVAATSFHWIQPEVGLSKVRHLLRRGGTVALMWNVLQDLDKEDPFHDATQTLLAPLAVSTSGAPDTIPFALDREAREADAKRAGFESARYAESRWSLVLTTAQVGALYEGFSSIQRLDEGSRISLLDQLMHIADNEFQGRVVRNVTSCLYQFS